MSDSSRLWTTSVLCAKDVLTAPAVMVYLLPELSKTAEVTLFRAWKSHWMATPTSVLPYAMWQARERRRSPK